jgi:hypothetical protein
MGIRGTAVLVEIDFTIPGQGTTPDAHFQVLVEPDGTTGSYILFDKTTLQPLAVVNQAGQQINISNGVLSQSSAPLSPDVEKLIQDVFTLKFSANDTNPKTTTAQTDTTNPLLFGPTIKLANGTSATPIYQQTALNTNNSPTSTTPDNSGPTTLGFIDHAPVITSSPQTIKFSGGQLTTGGSLNAPISGMLNFTDTDLGDTHTLALTMSAVMSDGEQLSTGLQDLFKNALTVSLGSDSSSTGNGVIDWQLAQLPVYLADFIPAGQTLTLTYTITVTDSHGESGDQTVTVTITGTDKPAVVWIATTTGEPTGASWNNAANWETKTVPTASDDVIIITNQLIGLTPNYPVKVDSKDAAAHSVTMNDYSSIAPELDILSGAELTVGSTKHGGSGGIFLNSDSKLHISGTLELENGGDFADQSQVTIDEGGLIEVAGGTLIVSVDISNLGQFTVDKEATLTLNSGTIDGGEANGTLSISGTLNLEGSSFLKNGTLVDSGHVNVGGAVVFDNEAVTNNSSSAIDITGALTLQNGSSITNGEGNAETVESDASLTLSDTSAINGGLVTNEGTLNLAGLSELKGGQLDNTGSVNVTGGGVVFDGEAASNMGAGSIDITGALTLQNQSSIANGEGNAETVESEASLTLSDTSFISGGLLTNEGTLNLAGSSELEDVQLDNTGNVNVTGGGVVFNGEAVSNTGAGLIDITGALTLQNGSSITNGESSAVTIESEASLTLQDTSFISGGLVTNEGTLNLADSSELNGGQLDNTGSVNVSGGSVVLAGESVNNTGIFEIDATGALTIDHGSTVTGDGQIRIDRTDLKVGQLVLNDATVDGASVVNSGAFDITGSAVLKNGTLENDNYIIVSGADNAFHDENVTVGGGIVVSAEGALTIDQGSTVADPYSLEIDGTLVLNDATIDTGVVYVDPGGIVNITGSTALTAGKLYDVGQVNISGTENVLDGETVSNTESGAIDITGALTLRNGSSITNDEGNAETVESEASLTLQGASSIIGGELINLGTVYIETSTGATFDGVRVDNTDGTIQVDFGPTPQVTLQLDDGAAITGGTLDIGKVGELDVSTEGGATLSGVTVDNSGHVQVDEGAVLALAGSSIENGSVVNDGTINSTGISAIDGADITNDGVIEALSGTLTIDPGTLTNSSTLEADGGELDISGETVGNTGTVGATAGGLLKLISSTIENSGDGTVTVDASSTLDLDHSGISGGTLIISGTLDNLAGSNIITSAVIETGSGSIVVSGGALDLAGSVAGDVTISGDSTVELGAAGTSAYAETSVIFATSATGTLVLDHAESFTGTITGLDDDNTIDLADISYASNPTVSYANGVLSIFVGGVDVANLNLTGNYSGVHWVLGEDSSGHTTVTEAPGAISGLDANGNADQGTALSVSITDGGASVTGATYDWQVSTDGVHWTEAHGKNGLSSYTPVDADDGQLLRVELSFTDSNGNAETSSVSAGVVVSQGDHDLVTTLSTSTIEQGLQITVTGVTDDGKAVTSGLSYSWQVSSDGTDWTQVNTNSYYAPTEQDEGKSLRLVTSYIEPSGHTDQTVNDLGTVGDIAPTLVAPFSVAVDEMKVVKNGHQVFDDHFAQAPPVAGTFGDSAVQFITQGSTWTDVGGKGIMSANGVQTLPTVNGAEVLARLGTNNQDESVSNGGLKEDATFTVSTTFDLTVPHFAGQQYGIDLNDSSATHANDEMVELYVVGDGHGGATVKLVQADFATTTFTTLASQTLTADQLAGNNQIELDLAHLDADSSTISGSFELLNDGRVTSSETFDATGHVFNNTTYTRADIFAFAPTAVVITGEAQQGQTLTANTVTNEADATINYEWQHSSDGVHWSDIGTNSSTYVVQEGDQGFSIHVIATTADGDNSNTPASATSAATAVVQAGDLDGHHQAPVIETDKFTLTHNDNGTITIAGLQVNDSDPSASTETFSLSASTGSESSSVSPSSDSGSLADVNTDLKSITYDPTANGPAPHTDQINVTVTDSFGAGETVHFIFNEGGGSHVTLQGTSGNNVIFATGHADTLVGGGQDQFVFKPTSGEDKVQHTVVDFNTSTDTIDVRQFGSIKAWTDVTATQHGNDTLLTLDSHDSILLKNVLAANLHASDFIVTPHNIG